MNAVLAASEQEDLEPSESSARCRSIPSFDDGEFKEVYAQPTTEIQFVLVQRLFNAAGYVVRRAEVSPHGLPLAFVRMSRKTAPLLGDRRKFRQHIKQILKSAPPWFNQAELDVHQQGANVLISFLWEHLEESECPLEHEFLPIPL